MLSHTYPLTPSPNERHQAEELIDSLADYLLVSGLWVFTHFKSLPATPSPGEATGQDEKLWTRWRTWLDAVENRPSVRNTMSEREYYLPIYERYHNDSAMSELAKATRTGRGVP